MKKRSSVIVGLLVLNMITSSVWHLSSTYANEEDITDTVDDPNPGGDSNSGGEPEPGTDPNPGGDPNSGGEPEPDTDPNPGGEPEPSTDPNPGGDSNVLDDDDLGIDGSVVGSGEESNESGNETSVVNEETTVEQEETSVVIPQPRPIIRQPIYVTRPTTAPVSLTPNSNSDAIQSEPVEIDLSKVLEQLLANPAMVTAYDDYQFVIENFQFNDEMEKELTGSSIKEVREKFQSQGELSETEYEEMKVLEYLYGKEETEVRIALYFTEDTLTAAVLEDLNPVLENGLSSEDNQVLANNKLSYDEVVDMLPNIISIVHMQYNAQTYDALVVPSGSEKNLALEYIEVSPLYVINEIQLRVEDKELSDLNGEFIVLKHRKESVETSDGSKDEEIMDVSFVDQILGNREFDESNLLTIQDLESKSNQVLEELNEQGIIQTDRVQTLMGQASESNEIGQSSYNYYYAYEEDRVSIVSLQYSIEDNSLLSFSQDNYQQTKQEFPINVEELTKLVSEEFDLQTLTDLLGVANKVIYSPGQNQVEYTWISDEDKEMSSIGAVIDLVSGKIGVFYNPVQ